MSYKSINFNEKLRLFDERWQPKVIAEMNEYQFKVVKLRGDFIWHDHKDTDEAFLVIEGDLRIFAMGRFMSPPERCSSFQRGSSTSPTLNGRSSCY